jgi:hypothetical protein
MGMLKWQDMEGIMEYLQATALTRRRSTNHSTTMFRDAPKIMQNSYRHTAPSVCDV